MGFISTQSLPKNNTEHITDWECWGQFHHKNKNLGVFSLILLGVLHIFPQSQESQFFAVQDAVFQEHLRKYYLHIVIHLFIFLLESDLKASN